MIRNKASFLWRGFVNASSNPQAGGPLLAGCPRLLFLYTRSYPLHRRPFFLPQLVDAPCRGDGDPLITGFIVVADWKIKHRICVTAFFIVEPCIDTISINSNQLMHISAFIKNTLKFYLKFLLPRHVSDHIGIHPQGAIVRS